VVRPTPDGPAAPLTARHFFGSELRRLRLARELSQEQLAAQVMHSRALVTAVELGERWPPQDLATRCDEVLQTGGALNRLWPLVDSEHRTATALLAGDRLADVRATVLRLAVLTGTDLSVLSVREADQPEPAVPPPAGTATDPVRGTTRPGGTPTTARDRPRGLGNSGGTLARNRTGDGTATGPVGHDR